MYVTHPQGNFVWRVATTDVAAGASNATFLCCHLFLFSSQTKNYTYDIVNVPTGISLFVSLISTALQDYKTEIITNRRVGTMLFNYSIRLNHFIRQPRVNKTCFNKNSQANSERLDSDSLSINNPWHYSLEFQGIKGQG